MSLQISNLRLKRAVEALKAGRMIVLVDDESRENEGDVVMAAEHMTPEAMNFMVTHARGLVCLPLEAAVARRLGLTMMTAVNNTPRKTAFTVSIEAREGIETGISAADRAHTARVAANPHSTAADIVSPGHMFPLVAARGGVLARDGHTEGATDLMKMAGLTPVSVICEIMSHDGTMARMPELERFSRQHGLPLATIEDIIHWRTTEATDWPDEPADPPLYVERVAHAALPGLYGGEEMRIHAFRDATGVEHLALVKGELQKVEAPVVRLHSECLTGDALGSLRCDCGPQLQSALRTIGESEAGVLLYLRGHEGRGIGLGNKIRAYELQDQGYDTVDANERLGFAADMRDWGAAVAMLKHLGITVLDLLTNNPAKIASLERSGLKVRRQVPLEITSNPFNRHYLNTKRTRMGHSIAQGPEETRIVNKRK